MCANAHGDGFGSLVFPDAWGSYAELQDTPERIVLYVRAIRQFMSDSAAASAAASGG